MGVNDSVGAASGSPPVGVAVVVCATLPTGALTTHIMIKRMNTKPENTRLKGDPCALLKNLHIQTIVTPPQNGVRRDNIGIGYYTTRNYAATWKESEEVR